MGLEVSKMDTSKFLNVPTDSWISLAIAVMFMALLFFFIFAPEILHEVDRFLGVGEGDVKKHDEYSEDDLAKHDNDKKEK